MVGEGQRAGRWRGWEGECGEGEEKDDEYDGNDGNVEGFSRKSVLDSWGRARSPLMPHPIRSAGSTGGGERYRRRALVADTA